MPATGNGERAFPFSEAWKADGMVHESMPGPRFPFRARQHGSSDRWGVWDNRHAGWAVTPRFGQALAQTMASAMVEAYAAGAADTVIIEAR